MEQEIRCPVRIVSISGPFANLGCPSYDYISAARRPIALVRISSNHDVPGRGLRDDTPSISYSFGFPGRQ